MRIVEQAVEVANEMEPLLVPGPAAEDMKQRENVFAHLFVGGNSNSELVGNDATQAQAALHRLKTAASLALDLPAQARAGEKVVITVLVSNTSAGHAIPTSITELREVWLDVEVTDANGAKMFRSGHIDEHGRVDANAVMYHSRLVDETGNPTYLPWRAVKMEYEKLIPPKATVNEEYLVAIPSQAEGELSVRVVLRYRSAPQNTLDELFGEGTLPMTVADMAEVRGQIAIVN